MTTNDDFIPVETIEFIPVGTTEPSAPSRVRTPRIITIGAAAIIAVAALSVVFPKSGNEPAQPAAPPVHLSEREKLEVLVTHGLVPRQALEPASLSKREKLQDLVDRGLIPRQALEPAPLTMEQKLQDLVDRGLIPRQALLEAPVAIIYGPTHPLGAPDIGIPCGERVYTRC
jgi:hypothetical protein